MTNNELLSQISRKVRAELVIAQRERRKGFNTSNYVEAAKAHKNDGKIMAYEDVLKFLIMNGGI